MKPLIKSRSTVPGNAQSLSTIYAAVTAPRPPPTGVGRTEAVSATTNTTPVGRVKLLLINFFRTTSVHGFVNTVQVGVHFVERVLWFLCILVAILGALSVNKRIWSRFNSSPTVIAMDRNKFFWNTTFPSVTLCPHQKIDDNKLRLYFAANPEKFPRATDQAAFRAFVHKLSNATFETFHEVPSLNGTVDIPAEDYMELLHNLTLHFNPDITSGSPHKLHMTETITEIGICYAVNSRVAAYNSFSAWKENRWTAIESPETVVVHPFDGEIYANIINISTSYDVFFHAAHEVPDITKQRYSFAGSDYSTVELEALEIITSRDAKALRISQRKCRFTEEARNLATSPVYSFIICRIECRLKLALMLCNCIPHFYRRKGKDGRTFRVCDFQGMQCLYRNRNDLLSLPPTKAAAAGKPGLPPHQECKCDRNCDDSNFSVQNLRSRVWFLGANLQYGINVYPKMQLRRNVLFRFEDLLAYIGSTAGLFLGCSLLSFTEFIYFFTWRFVKLVFFGERRRRVGHAA